MNRFVELTNVVKKHYLILDLVNNDGWLVLPDTPEWRCKIRISDFSNAYLEMKPIYIPPENMTPQEFDIMLTMDRL